MIPLPEGGKLDPAQPGDWNVLTTPFLDPSNDCIQICVREAAEGLYELSDDEDAANYLFMHGIDDEKKIRPVMERIARCTPNMTCTFPVFEAKCGLPDFIQTYHSLVGCILQTEAAVLWRGYV